MSTGEQLRRIPTQEELLAPFLVLLIGKLTGWNEPTGGGGDPVYLTGEQTAALAAEGINLLAPYLPQETSQRVKSAIERISRLPQGSTEQMLLNIGRMGWPTVFHSGGGEGPGCCVGGQHGLVCVKVRA